MGKAPSLSAVPVNARFYWKRLWGQNKSCPYLHVFYMCNYGHGFLFLKISFSLLVYGLHDPFPVLCSVCPICGNLQLVCFSISAIAAYNFFFIL